MKLIMTKGLPASGKTTWAKKYITENPNTIRINKDDLRNMLHNGVWSNGREKTIIDVRNMMITYFLGNGHDVIVDDTNLNTKHELDLRNIAVEKNADFVVRDYTDVDVEECIRRDQNRSNYVGEKVIRKMYNQYLRPKPVKQVIDIDLPFCIICDIDGTLAHMKDRGPFDWDKVGNDEPNFPIMGILGTYKDQDRENPHWEPVRVILFSGRNEVCRKETEEWLDRFDVEYDALYMRKEDDSRKDSIIKKELYEQHIQGKYNVHFVLDDRNQVVDLWRSLGLTCLQVAEGDF